MDDLVGDVTFLLTALLGFGLVCISLAVKRSLQAIESLFGGKMWKFGREFLLLLLKFANFISI